MSQEFVAEGPMGARWSGDGCIRQVVLNAGGRGWKMGQGPLGYTWSSGTLPGVQPKQG